MQRKNICYTGENGGQKITRKTKIWLGVAIVLQMIIYLVAGMNKAYLHMDEAFSLGLAQYDKINIQDEVDFYNHWHTDEYYQDYLALQKDERGEFKAVYENQKNDVHPPLYYLLLRIVMGISPGRFSKWPGIILNMVIQVGNTIVLFLIVRELLGKRMESREKLVVVMAGVAGLTMAAVSAVVYIRMYQLLTFWVLLTLWMNLRIRQEGKLEMKDMLLLFLVVVLGCLTQYYYIFGLGMMWLVMVVWYAKEKKWREFAIYTGVLIGAGGVVFLIWPHLIQHLFGYRGQGAVGNLLNFGQMGKQVWDYVLLMDYYDFHRGLLALLVVGIGLWVWKKLRKKEMKQQGGARGLGVGSSDEFRIFCDSGNYVAVY